MENQKIWNGEPEKYEMENQKIMTNWTIWNREPGIIKQRTWQYEMKNQTITEYQTIWNEEPDRIGMV